MKPKDKEAAPIAALLRSDHSAVSVVVSLRTEGPGSARLQFCVNIFTKKCHLCKPVAYIESLVSFTLADGVGYLCGEARIRWWSVQHSVDFVGTKCW